VAGTICVTLGVVGIILPLVPTTPFLLLAAYCYARSSERLLQWLLANRWFGEHIRNYREGRGMTRRHKVLAMAVLWVSIGSSAALIAHAWWVRAILVSAAAGVTVYLLRLGTYTPNAD